MNKSSNHKIIKSNILIYQTEGGQTKIEVRLENETVWLTQKLMAELFQVGVNTVNYHIKEIYSEGELMPEATIRKFRIVQKEGKREVSRAVDFYNLDMIISVGYRIKSHVATRFRQWATQRLREYIIKGFVLDDERLKNPDQPFDYFDELLRRIQDIRTSERRFYQKITDIYATSIDYDPTIDISINFFKTVQNKLHWAITGQTAAEIIYDRVDSEKTNMGLTSWRGEKVLNLIFPALIHLLKVISATSRYSAASLTVNGDCLISSKTSLWLYKSFSNPRLAITTNNFSLSFSGRFKISL